MKSKLLKLTVAAFVAMSTYMHAQTAPATLGAPIVIETFENWTGSVPTDWEVAPANTIPASQVAQVVTTNTAIPVEQGIYSCKLVNSVASYTPGIFASTGVAVTAGMGYQISYYARGKGTINVEVTDGSAATTFTNYASTNGQTVSGKAWHKYVQTVTAPTTTNNAQFCLKVKSTTTYTAAGGISITGIDVDSFVVRPYTITPSANLYSLEYTPSSTNGNSLFFGQTVAQTGGIVTAVILSSTGPEGYYVQTTGSTAWAAGLVFDQTNAPNVSVGDSITFGCSVDEYFNMTELVSVTNFSVVSHNNPVKSLGLTASANSLAAGVNTQTLAQEQYEGFLVNIVNATVNTYSANYAQGTITDVASGVPCTYDSKSNFYAPNGTGTYSFTPSATPYCMTGNINYEFSAYNIVPRDSGDIIANCTTAAGIAQHNSIGANVYPNPMANELNIQLPVAAANVSVSITDMMGREVVAPVTTNGTNININNLNLNPGTYFVKITADGKTQITKVIK